MNRNYPLADYSCVDMNFLVIEHLTGVKVCGQVGGLSCLHPEIEGFTVLVENNLSDLENLSCELGCYGKNFTNEDYIQINEFFPIKQVGFNIFLDAERISLGTEAWIPVRMKTDTCLEDYKFEPLARWIDNKKGFLLIGNCD